MSLSASQSNVKILQSLPRFYTIRFSRNVLTDNDEEKIREFKFNEIHRFKERNEEEEEEEEDFSSAILLTGIRNRDWHFEDDMKNNVNETHLPNIKYKLIPSITNTIKTYSTNVNINHQGYQYEEYDLDEQDFQWLIAYNQFRIEKNLPELDENIFEYIIQLFEYQCALAIREKNYQDTIQCDSCYRIDDVDDLIQCIQCQTIVHQKCYGIEESINEWTCLSCQDKTNEHRCYICNQNKGALKTFQSSSNDQEVNRWVHLACAFWTSQFEFHDKMTLILNESLQTDGRCHLCSKTSGIKLHCSWTNCQDRFHAKCALDAGYDMFIVDNEDKTCIYLLSLCHRHTEKLDQSEKRLRIENSLEIKQKRLNEFSSYINFDLIQKQTCILPDILSSIHTYYILKRQANNCQPLIDLSDEIFEINSKKHVNVSEFARQYHFEHQEQTNDFLTEKSNVLRFLSSDDCQQLKTNFFVKYAQYNRKTFLNYERNQFCLIDAEKKRK